MTKTKSPRRAAPAAEPTYTINALASLLEVDRRTLGKALKHIPPDSTGNGKRWRLDRARTALDRHRAKRQRKSALADAKLVEQIRKLKIANDREEAKYIDRELVLRETKKFAEAVRVVLERRLEEWANLVTGMDIPAARQLGANIHDMTVADIGRVLETLEM